MGVDYFPCDHCGEVTSDHDDNKILDIRGYKEQYLVCPNCIPSICTLVKLAHPLPYPCFTEHKETKKRCIFDNYKDLVEFMKSEKEDQYRFGVYCNCIWNQLHREAFIGEGRCGGMTDEQILSECETMLERINVTWWKKGSFSWTNIPTLYVGFRGYRNKRGEPESLIIDVVSPQQVLQEIKKFQQMEHLEDRPVCVASFSNLTSYHYNVLDDFCLPDESKLLEWCSTLDEVKQVLSNPEYGTEDDEYIATPEFISGKLAELKQKKREIEEEIDSLENYNFEVSGSEDEE